MKLEIERSGATVLLRAETPDDLDFLERMRGIHQPGPWGQGEFIKIPVAELGFEATGAGCSWMGRDQRINATLGAVRLRMDWLTYQAPVDAEKKLRADAAARVGHSLLDALDLAWGRSK